MSTPFPDTVENAEKAWLEVFLDSDHARMRSLLHPEFIAVHGPSGSIQGADVFAAMSEKRPPAAGIEVFEPTVRQVGDVATVSCIQEFHVAFEPDVPPFAFQAACSRVWTRGEDGWKLLHLQMARRIVPG